MEGAETAKVWVTPLCKDQVVSTATGRWIGGIEEPDDAECVPRPSGAQMKAELARDLHDGLCQELAVIVGQARCLASRHGDDQAIELIAEAAERALDEARWTIASLTADDSDRLLAMVRAYARGASERLDCTVRVVSVGSDAPEDAAGVQALRAARDEVVRLAEAGTKSVRIEVGEHGDIRVRGAASG